MPEELKNGTRILAGQVVLELLLKTIFFNNSRTAGPTINLMPGSDNLLHDAYTIFSKHFIYFDVAQKTC